jgi:hypothetical protein
MDKQTIALALVAALVGGLIVLVFSGLVGDNQPVDSDVNVGAGTRFPNGLSVDGTSPSAGQVRSTTLTVSGAATIGGALTALELTEAASGTDNTLTVAESGTTFYISGDVVATTTLPAVASSDGVEFTFVLNGALGADHIIDSAEGDNLEGNLNGTTTVNAADRVYFVSSIENIGDTVHVRSDGTNWFVQGSSLAPSGLAADG